MNIVLIGMRGSGKSTIGKLLAKKLNRDYEELDKLIEQRVKMPISKFVKKAGWEHFRDVESEIVNRLSQKDNIVIATGGGVILCEENVRHLRKNGYIIWLHAKLDILAERIGSDTKRPFLTDAKTVIDDLRNVFAQRQDLYKGTSRFIIDTGRKSESEVVDTIMNHVQKSGII